MSKYLHKVFNFSHRIEDLFSLFAGEKHLFFLQSSYYDEQRGRYSFLGFEPFDLLSSGDTKALKILSEKFRFYSKDFSRLSAGNEKKRKEDIPFWGGMVGHLSYDYGLQLAGIQSFAIDDLACGNCFFGFYDCILAFDHQTKKLHVFSSGLPEQNSTLRNKRAESRIQYVTDCLFRAEEDGFFIKKERKQFLFKERAREGLGSSLGFISNLGKEEYLSIVKKALDYIGRGEIYQVNLSQRFRVDVPEEKFKPANIYNLLAELSPSPFGGYLDCGDYQIISSSPERFLSLRGNTVETIPMKGTRPRGIDLHEDEKYLDQLLSSEKEKAELLMITDLERNDLGRVCKYGSVKVDEMRRIEKYNTVFQATSRIQGELREDKSCFDLIESCFPGGSITGCPKRRAMEIIDQLEPTKRSIYTGSLGYVDFSGDMDFNILIRTLLAYKNTFYFQVGGGIVFDSIPESEYQETLIKAKAMIDCLERIIK